MPVSYLETADVTEVVCVKNFVFHNPTKILFGKDTVGKIGDEIASFGVKRVLFVYGGGSIKRNGVYDAVVESLGQAGVEYVEFPGIKPNPVLSKVYDGIEAARREGVGGVLAVGGGSVIDSSKAIGAGALYDGDVWDFFSGKAFAKESLPIFVVLTISATGSEMNGNAVITHDDTLAKRPFRSPAVYPKVSVIDPSVQFSLPREQTVYGAIDAMTHVFEFYFSCPEVGVTDRINEGLVKTIMDSAEKLVEDPGDYYHRANLAWSATLALNGISGAGTGGGDWSTHRIEHALSAVYDIAHGAGLAIVFPAWLRYVAEHSPPHVSAEVKNKILMFGKEVFSMQGSSYVGVIERLKKWYSDMGAPVYLEDAGISPDEIDTLATNPSIPYPLGSVKKLDVEDVRNILRLATRLAADE